MSLHVHHKFALVTISSAALLDVILGILFGFADHIPVWDALYFATVTATTVGYGDITPRGWEAHLIAVLIMVTVIPLFGAAFSLFTSGLSAIRLHPAAKKAAADAGAAREIAADLYRQQTGADHPLAAK